MLNRPSFLGTLIQRERGGEASAVSPRLASRYEQAERGGPVAAFDETGPMPVNREASDFDARQPDLREHSPKGPDTDSANGDSTPKPPGDTWAAQDERRLVENDVNIHPRPSMAVQSIQVGSGLKETNQAPIIPQTEEFDRIGSKSRHSDYEQLLKPRGDEQREAIPTTQGLITMPVEDRDQDLQPPGMAAHVGSKAPALVVPPELEARSSPQSAQRTNRLPLSPDSDQEATAVTKPAKAKQAERISPDIFVADMERVRINSARNDNHLSDVPRTGDSARQEERNSRNSRILPAPHMETSARVRATKTGDAAPFSLRPEASEPSRRQPNMPPPPEPTINVTIGRIEVRAVTAPAAPRRSSIGPKPMSLSEYLSRHSGNSNRRGT